MRGWEPPLRQNVPQRQRGLCRTGFAEQRFFQSIKSGKLIRFRQLRVIGNVVGRAREAVEAQDRPTQARRDQEGGDGKVFLALGLARFDMAAAVIALLREPGYAPSTTPLCPSSAGRPNPQ